MSGWRCSRYGESCCHLGLEAVAAEPKVAVVRCNGSCENRPRTALYDGAKSCAIAHATSGGRPVVHLVAWDVAIVWKCVSLMLFT